MNPPFELTLKSMIDRSCELFSRKPALSNVDGEPVTYGEMRKQLDGLMRMMSEQGIVKGDRVAILGQNMPNWGIAYLAIASLGAVVVPILTDFHVNEILNIVRHSEAKMIFVSGAQYDKIGYADLDPRITLVALDNFELLEHKAPKDLIGGPQDHFIPQHFQLIPNLLRRLVDVEQIIHGNQCANTKYDYQEYDDGELCSNFPIRPTKLQGFIFFFHFVFHPGHCFWKNPTRIN